MSNKPQVAMPPTRDIRISVSVSKNGRAYLGVVARTWQGAIWSDRRLIGMPLPGTFEINDRQGILEAAADALTVLASRID